MSEGFWESSSAEAEAAGAGAEVSGETRGAPGIETVVRTLEEEPGIERGTAES